MFKAVQKKSAPNSAQSSSLPSFLPENHTTLAGEVRSLASSQQELGSLTRPLIAQPKLTLNRPGDKYEQEADRVAEQVMRMPDKGVAGISKNRKEEKVQLKPLTATMTPLLQRQSDPEDKTEEDEEEIQAKPLATQITPLVQRQAASEEEMEEEEIGAKAAPGGSRTLTPPMAANINALRGGGQPLPETTRSFFEARFGVDFGQVRVHTGPRAMETARGVSARAYTIGRDIVFGSGQYALESVPGKKLLAHELTHTLQQKAAEKLPNSAGTFIQRSEKETKQLCPRYWKYNTKKKFKDYNCAGLSHRTYVYIDPIKDLPKMLPQSSARSKCKAGEVKHWVWLYWFHLENHKGKVIQKPLLGVHTVAGVVGKKGNDPTDVYSKNGVRPVEGPGTGPSFKPKAKEHATKNTPRADLMYDGKGKPKYKIRKKFETWTYCLPCPKP